MRGVSRQSNVMVVVMGAGWAVQLAPTGQWHKACKAEISDWLNPVPLSADVLYDGMIKRLRSFMLPKLIWRDPAP